MKYTRIICCEEMKESIKNRTIQYHYLAGYYRNLSDGIGTEYYYKCPYCGVNLSDAEENIDD